MTEKKKLPTLTSPRMTLKWPKLNEPDYGSKDYPKEDGEFSTKGVLRLGSPECDALLKVLQPLHDEAVSLAEQAFKELKVDVRKKLEAKNGKKGVQINALYTAIYDKETEEPTGDVEFKFVTTASGVYKNGPKAGKRWNREVAIFDAKGIAMAKAPDIWGGTVAKVSYKASPYFIAGTGAAGLKLNLDAVQIIDLVSKGSRAASSYGFGEEDGGYEYDPSDDSTDDASGDGEQAGEQRAAPGETDF
ncbi:MAG: hypothetical protein Q7V31_12145 [Parvibaculum sp.]|uniref:hypothetical protein n=1 Tax=Parvibaculum sp. TaxID=2024848 RepID=UPI0027231DCC|nr:hypothetical protein [Parvibaculum sp.]MDO8839668.1 hypothetical protein [Parvibaculum sp.]